MDIGREGRTIYIEPIDEQFPVPAPVSEPVPEPDPAPEPTPEPRREPAPVG